MVVYHVIQQETSLYEAYFWVFLKVLHILRRQMRYVIQKLLDLLHYYGAKPLDSQCYTRHMTA